MFINAAQKSPSFVNCPGLICLAPVCCRLNTDKENSFQPLAALNPQPVRPPAQEFLILLLHHWHQAGFSNHIFIYHLKVGHTSSCFPPEESHRDKRTYRTIPGC